MGLLMVFLSGVLFALGLGIAGMTQPTKIIAFLDIFGDWDPSLILVMAGAVAINLVLYRFTLRREKPILEDLFTTPSKRPINARLAIGAGLFGIGWGLSGYCPGPALVSTVTGWGSVLTFVAAMLLGMLLFQWLQTEEPRPVDAEQGSGQAESSCG